MANLAGRVALITGVGRRQGIGAAVARELADAGADILTSYYHPYDAELYGTGETEALEIVDELRALGVRAAGIEADLADPAGPARLFDEAQRRLGPVDILVNNAAYSTRAGLAELTPELLDRHYAVNVRAMLLLCQAFARQHRGAPGGRVINLTSGQSLGPMPDELPYVATKAAIEGLTLSLSRAFIGQGITVNAIDPGATDTGWISDALRQELLAVAPLGRIGTPTDAARLVRFLVSDEAGWITGQVIHSRGGM